MFSTDIIKIFLIILSSYIFYHNISNWQVSIIQKVITGLIFCMVFTFAMRILSIYITEPFKTILMMMISGMFLTMVTKESYKNSCFSMMLAYAYSHVLYMLSSFVASIFYYILTRDDENIGYQALFLVLLFETVFFIVIKKKKISFYLPPNRVIEKIAIFFSACSILFYSITRELNMTNKSYLLLLAGAVLCIVGFKSWIKSENAIAYNFQAKDMETNRLINSMDKVKSEKERSEETLRFLEKKVHDDNKLFPAYQAAAEELLQYNTDKSLEPKLLQILGEVKNKRKEIWEEQEREMRKDKLIPKTGMLFLDAVFSHMCDVAARKDIGFDLILRGNMSGITGIITQLQLETLAGNLIQNAIIATEKNSYKNILAYFWLSRGVHELRIDDSGIPFEIDTLNHLGKCRITTHADTGGSGIGFMTIFEILHSCSASLIITEMQAMPYGYTKSIAIRFDGKNQKIIHSYRVVYLIEKGVRESWIVEGLPYK